VYCPSSTQVPKLRVHHRPRTNDSWVWPGVWGKVMYCNGHVLFSYPVSPVRFQTFSPTKYAAKQTKIHADCHKSWRLMWDLLERVRRRVTHGKEADLYIVISVLLEFLFLLFWICLLYSLWSTFDLKKAQYE